MMTLEDAAREWGKMRDAPRPPRPEDPRQLAGWIQAEDANIARLDEFTTVAASLPVMSMRDAVAATVLVSAYLRDEDAKHPHGKEIAALSARLLRFIEVAAAATKAVVGFGRLETCQPQVPVVTPRRSLRDQLANLRAMHEVAPGCLLGVYSSGFVEFYGDDAKVVSSVLGIVLNTRGKTSGDPIEFACFPSFRAEDYIGRLSAAEVDVMLVQWQSSVE